MAGFGTSPFGTSPFGVGNPVVSPSGISSGEAFGTALVTTNTGASGFTLFPTGREGFLAGEINWDTATITAAFVRGYIIDATHKFVSDVISAGGSIVATSALASKTVTGGVADAEDVLFPSVAAGPAITVLLMFQSSAVTGGVDVETSAQRLIGYVDSPPSLPLIPIGTDVAVSWGNAQNRIFIL